MSSYVSEYAHLPSGTAPPAQSRRRLSPYVSEYANIPPRVDTPGPFWKTSQTLPMGPPEHRKRQRKLPSKNDTAVPTLQPRPVENATTDCFNTPPGLVRLGVLATNVKRGDTLISGTRINVKTVFSERTYKFDDARNEIFIAGLDRNHQYFSFSRNVQEWLTVERSATENLTRAGHWVFRDANLYMSDR